MCSIDDIIATNTGLIMAQLKRLYLLRDPEAESLGYEALYNAAVTFDESKGYKFSTYATCCIYNALGTYIRGLNRKRQLEVCSYNEIAYSSEGVMHEFVDFLADSSDLEQDYLREELRTKICEAYLQSYNQLTNAKHKLIVTAWHDSDFEISNKEIAIRVGVSQPYVNQVINTFKFSIRKKLEVYYNA